MKKWIPNFLLAAASLTLTIIVVEFVLRMLLFNGNPAFDFLRKPQLYAEYERDATEHLYKEDYWKLHFLFSGADDLKEPHPLLGWDGNFNPETYEHADEFFAKGKRPVLLFGDSFTQCIDSTKCFEDFLNSDTAFTNKYYLLNFGVGGYGVDQIHLLMEQAVKRFEDPIVIFGMLTTDMDRSMLRFRDAPKPYFGFHEGELTLNGVPVQLGSSEYIDQHPVAVGSYVLRVFRNGLNWFVDNESSEESRSQITELNENIIRKQVAELRHDDIEPKMFLFQPTHQKEGEWRCDFLLKLFNDLNLETIDARKVLLEDMDTTKLSEEAYFIPGDLHPNSRYNRIIAEQLKGLLTNM